MASLLPRHIHEDLTLVARATAETSKAFCDARAVTFQTKVLRSISTRSPLRHWPLTQLGSRPIHLEMCEMSKKTSRAAFAVVALAATTLVASATARAQIRYEANDNDYVHANHSAGRDYCWYQHAWRGPGWYVCGYQWRRDFGWGGYDGWRWYPHRHHHHHHPHGQHPRPGAGPPPTGGGPAPGKPPPTNQPGGPPGGGHASPR
jgi:hypothetical protein